MNEQLFLRKMADLTETDLAEISLATKILDLSIWDSMAAAAFLAFAAEYGSADLVGGIQEARTVGDLFALVQGVGSACDH